MKTTEFTEKKYPYKELTEKIIGAAIEVHTALGPGLLESIYEEALGYEFNLRKIQYERQKEISLKYKNIFVGNHRIDFLVEENIIIELKSIEILHPIHKAQILTYLKASSKRIGLLINFNVTQLKDGIKRFIL
jgi:GxxExxY protein